MKKWLSGIIGLVIFVLILVIKIPGLTPAQNATFAIFTIAAILWVSEVIPIYVTSLLILFLEGLLLPQYMENVSLRTFSNAFFSPILLLFLGGFAIARTITQYRLDERIAKIIVKRASGSPLGFLVAIVIVTAFLSMWMSNTATAALMLAVPLPILKQLDADDKYRIGVILAVPFAANIGGIGTPIGTPPNAIALSQLKNHGIDISFAKWLLISFPVLIVTLIFMVFVLYKLFPPKIKKLPDLDVEIRKITGKQLTAIAVIVLTILLWLTTSIHHQSSYLIALIPVLFVFGSGMLKTDHFQQLGWNVLILIGGGTALGAAIKLTGLDIWIIDKVGLGRVAPLVAVAIAALASGLFSNFISNTSTAALIVPIVLGLASIDPKLGAIAVAMGASSAMILPISTPPNAIAYSSDMIDVKHMIKGGSLVFAFMMIVVIIHTLFIWKFLL